MGKKHCTVGFIAAGQAFADGYHGTVHPFTYDFNYCTMPGQWCQHNTKCCTKRDFLYFCVNFWAICQNSVQASFLPAEHILQTFYFCCCHSRFAFILSKQNSGPPLWERPPLQTIRCHAFSFIFAEQSLHSAQHIVLLFISANLLVNIIVQFFYCVSPLCIIHVDLFPWPRWF